MYHKKIVQLEAAYSDLASSYFIPMENGFYKGNVMHPQFDLVSGALNLLQDRPL